jgi:hypothetical protein
MALFHSMDEQETTPSLKTAAAKHYEMTPKTQNLVSCDKGKLLHGYISINA